MFLAEDTREDDYRGEVGQIVKAIQQIPTVTNEKRALIAELQNVAANHGYITFSAGNHRWHVGRVGENRMYCLWHKVDSHIHGRPSLRIDRYHWCFG